MTRLDISYYQLDGRGGVYPYWRNLVEHIHETDGDPQKVWARIHKEVNKYNGKVKENHLVFAKDSDATMFLLRWS